mgnify:CR=1 FL=1
MYVSSPANAPNQKNRRTIREIAVLCAFVYAPVIRIMSNTAANTSINQQTIHQPRHRKQRLHMQPSTATVEFISEFNDVHSKNIITTNVGTRLSNPFTVVQFKAPENPNTVRPWAYRKHSVRDLGTIFLIYSRYSYTWKANTRKIQSLWKLWYRWK